MPRTLYTVPLYSLHEHKQSFDCKEKFKEWSLSEGVYGAKGEVKLNKTETLRKLFTFPHRQQR